MRFIAGECDDWLDILDNVCRLLGGIRLVNRYGDRTDRRACEVHDRPVVAGGGVDDHHAAVLDADTQQTAGDRADTVIHLLCADRMPYTVAFTLPFGYRSLRIALCTLREERVDRIVIRGLIDRINRKFFQHVFNYSPMACLEHGCSLGLVSQCPRGRKSTGLLCGGRQASNGTQWCRC